MPSRRQLLLGAAAMGAGTALRPAAAAEPKAAWHREADVVIVGSGAAAGAAMGNFHGYTNRGVAPYHEGLKPLPAYLQQLEMESNGKRVDLDGQDLPYATSPVVWGEPGTNGQHAYFQMLHQGTDVIPVEFIAVREPTHDHAGMHTKLLANCFAQSQALMLGKTTEQALKEKASTASMSLDDACWVR